MNVNLWEQLILQFYFDILWEMSSGLQFFFIPGAILSILKTIKTQLVQVLFYL